MKQNLLRHKSRALIVALTAFVIGPAVHLAVQPAHAEPSDKLQEPEAAVVLIKPRGYKPMPASKLSAEGESAFKTLNCIACHTVRGVGGTLAPPLDGIGEFRSADILTARLTNSDEQKKRFVQLTGSETPDLHVRLSDDTAKGVVAYLLTLPEPAGGFAITPHARRLPAENHPPNPAFKPQKKSASSEQGKNLFDKMGCLACHSINNVGGWFGPRLDGVGGIHNRAYITAHITDAQIHVKQTASEMDKQTSEMPLFKLNEKEVRQIVDYLETLPSTKLPESKHFMEVPHH